jgi:hypothetical protein
MLLTHAELQELTGYRLPAHQIRWLRDHRWAFEVGGDGKPKVLRSHAERRLGGVDSAPSEPRLRLPA